MQIGPFVHESTTAGPFECSCDECGEMYAAESAAECAAEARNEMALYGPTQQMLDEAEVERQREAYDPFLIFLEERREADMQREEGRWEEEEFYAWKDSLSA